MWIFREGRETVCSRGLTRELQQLLSGIFLSPTNYEQKLDALIRAGELESALADQSSPSAAAMARVSDALASTLLNSDVPASLHAEQAVLDGVELPESVAISPPEGFAYYALHPVDFAEAAARIAERRLAYAVVGIRNIGTTLSAVTATALRKLGSQAGRMTVRPTGHPYDRTVRFSTEQVQWIRSQLENSAKFLIVDEGPGLSGSSFLSVGEALAQLGVPTDRITFMGTREPDVAHLCARDAATRWPRFGWRCVASSCAKRFADHTSISSGAWRSVLFSAESDWPATWTGMERAKFLSPDRKWLFKFEGLGRFGKTAMDRALRLSSAGFAPDALKSDGGFVNYPFLPAHPLSARNLSREILDQMAAYCAFRADEFAVSNAPPQQLGEMVCANLKKEFGDQHGELPLATRDNLITSQPIIADARMQPYEWLRQPDGGIWKTDAVAHGADHFFPGPTDIAWDLAGAVIEWEMDANAADYFLLRYADLSGDDARPRLPAFLLAYAVFRMGYCKMAMEAEAGSPEELRLRGAYRAYRDKVQQLLAIPWQAYQHSVV